MIGFWPLRQKVLPEIWSQSKLVALEVVPYTAWLFSHTAKIVQIDIFKPAFRNSRSPLWQQKEAFSPLKHLCPTSKAHPAKEPVLFHTDTCEKCFRLINIPVDSALPSIENICERSRSWKLVLSSEELLLKDRKLCYKNHSCTNVILVSSNAY